MQDMSEASFHQAVDRVQDLIEHALDEAEIPLEYLSQLHARHEEWLLCAPEGGGPPDSPSDGPWWRATSTDGAPVARRSRFGDGQSSSSSWRKASRQLFVVC